MAKLSTALLAVIMLMGSVSLYGNNIFYQADSLHHALKNAQSKRKLLLTYAARSSAPCCIAMEKATFRHPEILNALSTSFYPIKINLSDAIGQSWTTSFQIANTPTLLFFDNQGTLIKQVENAVSSKELKSILNEVLYFNTHGFWPMEDAQPVILPAYAPDQPVDAAAASSNEQSTENLIQNKTKNVNSGQTIRILLAQLTTKDPSVKSIVADIRKKFPQHPLKVKLVLENEIGYYQIWLEKFTKDPDAQLLLEALHADGFEKAEIIYTPK